jgi:hypothetical protein
LGFYRLINLLYIHSVVVLATLFVITCIKQALCLYNNIYITLLCSFNAIYYDTMGAAHRGKDRSQHAPPLRSRPAFRFLAELLHNQDSRYYF